MTSLVLSQLNSHITTSNVVGRSYDDIIMSDFDKISRYGVMTSLAMFFENYYPMSVFLYDVVNF